MNFALLTKRVYPQKYGIKDMLTEIHKNLIQVEERIRWACQDAGRKREDITLIAVSKTFSFDSIKSILDDGQVVFGENYVQEAEEKWKDQKEKLPGLTLHMVGPLQSNKVRQAVALFDAIHSLDRNSLAKELAKEFARRDDRPDLFIQVNTGEEPQKGGVLPHDFPDFLNRCRNEYGLEPRGLMCIPPLKDAPSPHFALLAKLAERHDLSCLSMGMSDDFEEAIRMGATHIRIGSAIFGERPQKSQQ